MKNSLISGNFRDAIRASLKGSLADEGDSDAGVNESSPTRAPSNLSSHAPTYGGIERVCEITGKSRATVFRWVNAGLIPSPFKLNGRTQNIWDIPQLLAAIASNAKKGA